MVGIITILALETCKWGWGKHLVAHVLVTTVCFPTALMLLKPGFMLENIPVVHYSNKNINHNSV